MVNEAASAARKSAKRKKDARLSKYGNWRLFPSEQHLLQYASNGKHFGRVKVGGKAIRRELDRTVRVFDFLCEMG
jgi:hypothetical protein